MDEKLINMYIYDLRVCTSDTQIIRILVHIVIELLKDRLNNK